VDNLLAVLVDLRRRREMLDRAISALESYVNPGDGQVGEPPAAPRGGLAGKAPAGRAPGSAAEGPEAGTERCQVCGATLNPRGVKQRQHALCPRHAQRWAHAHLYQPGRNYGEWLAKAQAKAAAS